MPETQGFHLSAALDGAGSHPAAPARPFTPEEYARLVRRAEAGLLDFITVEDGPGRLDSALLLALAAQVTDRIGLVPLGPATGDPGTWATRIATLDHLSAGRAGVRPRAATSDSERARLARIFGTAEGDRQLAELFAQADEFLTEATGAWGATVSSPQGRPPVALLAHATAPYRLAATHGDVVLVTPPDTAALVAVREEVEALREEAGRSAGSLRVFADVNVVLGDSQEAADARRAGLEEAAGAPFTSDAAVFSGTPDGLADLLEEWFTEGGADGFRLRPAVLPDDLEVIVTGLVPVLQRRGLFRTAYSARTLRGHLGLD
ncbi:MULTISPECIES: LLM class flavin-dependent oxidoreductase [unclassified Streptomyces]|uniref:LLM class flavin-dependent oxidoreductase n=1 Tax=unclassified Streptomyces TaxID=2593676 RepID=UPI0011CB5935|nr:MULTISPECIES: LLM class flavin-dependent oxidoreductase [unclassified Streptomyces]TXS10238.1 LLM class flavin-dependent oxidoreductase [Streptomyces sp. wa22]WSQ88248.1 LLM class flavin-dependent oxidoreductase [Streptomyces sp. NBC_01212]